MNVEPPLPKEPVAATEAAAPAPQAADTAETSADPGGHPAGALKKSAWKLGP